MALKLVVPPTTTPISLAEAKAHLNIDYNDKDSVILQCIATATDALDGVGGLLNRCLMPQTWDLFYDGFPTDVIKIPLPPLISVVFVQYADTDGNWQTVPATDYEVDLKNESIEGWVVPAGDWPSTIDSINTMQVRFQAGYPLGVPPAIRGALLLMVGNLFDIKSSTIVGDQINTSRALDDLLGAKRIMAV